MGTVVSLIYFHRKIGAVVLFFPAKDAVPAHLAFRVGQRRVNHFVTASPFHGHTFHGASRAPVQDGVEIRTVRQLAVDDFEAGRSEIGHEIARRGIHAVQPAKHRIMSHAGTRQFNRVFHFGPCRARDPVQPLRLHEPAVFLDVCPLFLVVQVPRHGTGQEIPLQFHPRQVAVLHHAGERHVGVHQRRERHVDRRGFQRVLLVQQHLGPRVGFVAGIPLAGPRHFQRVRHLQVVQHPDVNLSRQRQVGKTGKHLSVGLAGRRRKNPLFAHFRRPAVVFLPHVRPVPAAGHVQGIQHHQQFRLTVVPPAVNLEHEPAHLQPSGIPFLRFHVPHPGCPAADDVQQVTVKIHRVFPLFHERQVIGRPGLGQHLWTGHRQPVVFRSRLFELRPRPFTDAVRMGVRPGAVVPVPSRVVFIKLAQHGSQHRPFHLVRRLPFEPFQT